MIKARSSSTPELVTATEGSTARTEAPASDPLDAALAIELASIDLEAATGMERELFRRALMKVLLGEAGPMPELTGGLKPSTHRLPPDPMRARLGQYRRAAEGLLGLSREEQSCRPFRIAAREMLELLDYAERGA